MNNPLELLIPQKLARPKEDTWAVVVNLRPLAILVWGDTMPLQGAPETLVPLSKLKSGDRVIISFINNRVTIVGRLGEKAPDNKLLASGIAWYMNPDHTVLLSERVSEQDNGIMLRWQKYSSGSAGLSDIQYTVVPKQHITDLDTRGINCTVWTGASGESYNKYVYVSDTEVKGYTGNGNAPKNSHVLTGVIGF